MNLRRRLERLGQRNGAAPVDTPCPAQAAFRLWEFAVEKGLWHWAIFAGRGLRFHLQHAPACWEKPLETHQQRTFEAQAGALETDIGMALEEAWNELQRAGIIGQMQAALKRRVEGTL